MRQLPLPLVVQPLPDESWTGYVLRAAANQGARSMFQFLAFLDCTPGEIILPAVVDRMAYFNKADPAALTRMIPRPALGKRRHKDHWVDGVLYPHPVINHRRHRICPRCLYEHRYIRLAWHFTLFTCCPIHGIRLVERCGHCGRVFDWRRPAPELCKCGARLDSGMSAQPTPEELLFVGRLSASVPLVEQFPGAGLALSPAEWMLLTWFLGRHLNPNQRDGVGKSAEHPNLEQAEAIIKHALGVLRGWPAVLYDCRDWLSSRPSSKAQGKTVLARVRRHAKSHLTAPAFNFLHEALRAAPRAYFRRRFGREEHCLMPGHQGRLFE